MPSKHCIIMYQPKIMDPDPESMNPDPKHCIRYVKVSHVLQLPSKSNILSKNFKFMKCQYSELDFPSNFVRFINSVY